MTVVIDSDPENRFNTIYQLLDHSLIESATAITRYLNQALVPDEEENKIVFSAEKAALIIDELPEAEYRPTVTHFSVYTVTTEKDSTAVNMAEKVFGSFQSRANVDLDDKPKEMIYKEVERIYSTIALLQQKKFSIFYDKSVEGTAYQYNLNYSFKPSEINEERGMVVLSCAIGIKTHFSGSLTKLFSIVLSSKQSLSSVINLIVISSPVKENMSRSERQLYCRQVRSLGGDI